MKTMKVFVAALFWLVVSGSLTDFNLRLKKTGKELRKLAKVEAKQWHSIFRDLTARRRLQPTVGTCLQTTMAACQAVGMPCLLALMGAWQPCGLTDDSPGPCGSVGQNYTNYQGEAKDDWLRTYCKMNCVVTANRTAIDAVPTAAAVQTCMVNFVTMGQAVLPLEREIANACEARSIACESDSICGPFKDAVAARCEGKVSASLGFGMEDARFFTNATYYKRGACEANEFLCATGANKTSLGTAEGSCYSTFLETKTQTVAKCENSPAAAASMFTAALLVIGSYLL